MKKRVISALIMIMLFIPILLIGKIWYFICFSLIGLIGMWEILRLNKNVNLPIKIISYSTYLFFVMYSYFSNNLEKVFNFKVMGIIFIIYVLTMVINNNLKKYNYNDCLMTMIETIIIGFLFSIFILIRLNYGIMPMIYCLCVPVITDTFAYLGGKTFGNKKLAPSISPNKTWEGAICGSVVGTIISVFIYFLTIGINNLLMTILLTFVLTIIGQVGDLFFSSIKRYYDVKDFSNIIPGHGGILDRLDSILFVALGYFICMLLI